MSQQSADGGGKSSGPDRRQRRANQQDSSPSAEHHRQASKQAAAGAQEGYSGSLLNRDQLVHEASVYARNYYLRKKPESKEGFDLVEIFQIMPYVFEEEYPPKTLSRASYFSWDSNIARLFNRRFLSPRYQIAMEGIDHALEEGMIQAQHEHVWSYRVKVKMPPFGPPFVLMSDHIGISGQLAERYAKVLTHKISEKDFKVDPAIRRQIEETERDVRHVSRKLNRALKMKKEINERIEKHTQQREKLKKRMNELVNAGKRDTDEVRELVSDIKEKDALLEEYEDRLKRTEYKIEDYQDELEMLRDEAQDLRGEVNASG